MQRITQHFSVRAVVFCLALTWIVALPVRAQDTTQPIINAALPAPTEQTPVVPETPLKADAGEDKNVVVGRTVLFDGSGSTGPADVELRYRWDFGDDTGDQGIDATHVYNESGTYRVVLNVTAGAGADAPSRKDEIIVSVQDHIVVLVTDQSIPQRDVERFQSYGLTQGTLVISIRDKGVDQEYLTVQNLAQQFLENKENIASSDLIITWTSGNIGLNSFIELSRVTALNNTSLADFRFGTKAVIAVSNQSFLTSAHLAQAAFQNIQPRYILVADEQIIDDAIQAADPGALESVLTNTNARYQMITEYTGRGLGKIGPLNFLSYAVNFMINRGVPVSTLYLILMLPVMASVMAAARQLVGIRSFGIFAPTVIALSFLATGLKYGLVVFATVIVLGTIARLFARRLRILYLPRMAIVLSLLALALFCMFLIGAYFNKTGFIAISVFPILIMTVLAEHFISVQIEQGYTVALKLTLETLVLSIIGFLIGDWIVFKSTILAYPELILLTFLFNYVLGKFSGLRLVEYIRFRKVFKHIRHADKV